MGANDELCLCNPCLCETPPNETVDEDKCVCNPCKCDLPKTITAPETMCSKKPKKKKKQKRYRLNEFLRAKQFLKNKSTATGLNLFDHLSEILRKTLDFYTPSKGVDFVEEISLNLKRYRFDCGPDLLIDDFYISKNLVTKSANEIENWKRQIIWSLEQQGIPQTERKMTGPFPNMMRFLFYLELIGIGLQQEEMFKLNMTIRELFMTRPVVRIRFWGKIFGTLSNYYIVEAELRSHEEANEDLWDISKDNLPVRRKQKRITGSSKETICDPTEHLPGAGETFVRAGKVVTDSEILMAYQNT